MIRGAGGAPRPPSARTRPVPAPNPPPSASQVPSEHGPGVGGTPFTGQGVCLSRGVPAPSPSRPPGFAGTSGAAGCRGAGQGRAQTPHPRRPCAQRAGFPGRTSVAGTRGDAPGPLGWRATALPFLRGGVKVAPQGVGKGGQAAEGTRTGRCAPRGAVPPSLCARTSGGSRGDWLF